MSVRLTLALALLLFVSCTVTKRHYRKGFHVQWHQRYDRWGFEEEEKRPAAAFTDTLVPVRMAAGVPEPLRQEPAAASISKAPVPAGGQLRMSPVVSRPNRLHLPVTEPLATYRTRTRTRANDDYIDTAYALRKANLSLWLGILALVGFFVLGFWMLIVAVQAIKAGRQAMLVNSSVEDPLVERRARAGIRLGRAIIYLCEVILLMTATLLLVYFFLALGFSSGALVPVLGILCLIFFGLFVWMYIGLQKHLRNPDLGAKRRQKRNDGVIRIRQ